MLNKNLKSLRYIRVMFNWSELGLRLLHSAVCNITLMRNFA